MVPPLRLSAAQGMTWLPLAYGAQTRKATALMQFSNAFFPASDGSEVCHQQLYTVLTCPDACGTTGYGDGERDSLLPAQKAEVKPGSR